MSWKDAHPDAKIPSELADHDQLDDISYKNDMMPSFVYKPSICGADEQSYLMLWIDYEEAESEVRMTCGPDGPFQRFMICRVVDSDPVGGPLWMGNEDPMKHLERFDRVHSHPGRDE